MSKVFGRGASAFEAIDAVQSPARLSLSVRLLSKINAAHRSYYPHPEEPAPVA
jgi:hypothetical protein